MTTGAVEWPLWSTTARLVVTEPSVLERAAAIAARILGDVDAACSRFRSDSELSRIRPLLPRGVEVSELLATLVRHGLDAAAATDGDVDLTLGRAMEAAGYDRDIRLLEDSGSLVGAVISRRPGWRSVVLDGRHLRVPADLSIDLGATAKAVAADLVAQAVAEDLGCGVLVSLGGDIATAGPEPLGGWIVTVQDLPTDPSCRVRLNAGFAMATSSTQKRRWRRGGVQMHHILDPRTSLPAAPVWRSATVAAETCLRANVLSTASVVRGERATAWLREQGVAARLVHADASVVTVGGWPVDDAEDVLSEAV
jgi:thiamine biosynthesis lipoprotein